ncbi:hypothetical protein CPC698_1160, partial [Chlamydia psittaci C6/98]
MRSDQTGPDWLKPAQTAPHGLKSDQTRRDRLKR